MVFNLSVFVKIPSTHTLKFSKFSVIFKKNPLQLLCTLQDRVMRANRKFNCQFVGSIMVKRVIKINNDCIKTTSRSS